MSITEHFVDPPLSKNCFILFSINFHPLYLNVFFNSSEKECPIIQIWLSSPLYGTQIELQAKFWASSLETKIQSNQPHLIDEESKDLQPKTNSTEPPKDICKLTTNSSPKKKSTQHTLQTPHLTIEILATLKEIKENSKEFTVTEAIALSEHLSKKQLN